MNFLIKCGKKAAAKKEADERRRGEHEDVENKVFHGRKKYEAKGCRRRCGEHHNCSMQTNFCKMFRQHRGLCTVGRQTASGYHAPLVRPAGCCDASRGHAPWWHAKALRRSATRSGRRFSAQSYNTNRCGSWLDQADSRNPAQRGRSGLGRPRLRLLSPCWSVELQPIEFLKRLTQVVQACVPECFRFPKSLFPWASSSFRPRHTRRSAAASAPPSRSIVRRVTAATAEYSVSTELLPRAKLPGFLQSPRAGCKRACRTPLRAESCCGRSHPLL